MGAKPAMVSVVIAVRNEQTHIEACLHHLARQTYPKEAMEVIVVDGKSDDRTREIVQSAIARQDFPYLKLLDNPRRQRASALNIGVQHARGDFVVRVDGRTIVPEDYIERCVATSINTGADNVGGMQKAIVSRNGDRRRRLTQEAIGIALCHPFGVGNAQFRLGGKSGYADTVYLGCFRREIFQKVGLFDEHAPVISEDSDLNYRIRKAGGKVHFNKDIVAYYYPRDNIRDLSRLYFRYGGAKAGNLLKTKNLTAWRQWVPPVFLATIVLLAVLSFFTI
jgi:succinoglycan biosynthesis protein ExoA